MTTIQKYLKKQWYKLKGKSQKLPPYTYDYLCSTISQILHVESLCFREHIHNNNHSNRRLLIRHDVDHDIHSALEMAHIEANYDLTSTYFILHSAEYFKQNLRVTLDICHKIQELGHEIGLHNDLISDYYSNDLHPNNNLKQILKIFRDEEIQINGSASHGSKIIHELNNNCHDKSMIEYRNYLVFKEIYDKLVKLDKNKIAPLNSKLGNKVLKLPVFEMSEFDLAYEAYFIPYNHYVSDSGGNFWSYGSCPIETVSKSNQGHTIQCLFHPIWWKYDLK